MKKTKILDANAILRYIIYDIPEQANLTEQILRNEDVLILPEVIMEVIFVMFKFYKKTRSEISERIIIFLEDADCENNILANAIKTFGIVNLDFVDCLLFEYSKSQQYEVFTFDEDLKKLINKKVRHD